jgi:hypothetical protein
MGAGYFRGTDQEDWFTVEEEWKTGESVCITDGIEFWSAARTL